MPRSNKQSVTQAHEANDENIREAQTITHSLLHTPDLTLFETDFPDVIANTWAPPGGRIHFSNLKQTLNLSAPASAFADHNLSTITGQTLAAFLDFKPHSSSRQPLPDLQIQSLLLTADIVLHFLRKRTPKDPTGLVEAELANQYLQIKAAHKSTFVQAVVNRHALHRKTVSSHGHPNFSSKMIAFQITAMRRAYSFYSATNPDTLWLHALISVLRPLNKQSLTYSVDNVRCP